MPSRISKITSILTAFGAVQGLKDRAPGTAGIVVFSGETGAGKTWGMLATKMAFDAAYVRAEAMGSASSLMDDIGFELGADMPKTRAGKFKALCAALRESPVPVLIDESEYLMRGDGVMLSMVRDLHDVTGAPIVLVGMAGIVGKLQRWPEFARRVSQHVVFGRCSLDDTDLLAKDQSGVTIAPCLVKEIHAECEGSVGLTVVAITAIEKFAKARGWRSIDAGQWGGRPMFFRTGRGGRAKGGKPAAASGVLGQHLTVPGPAAAIERGA
jgi:hypothetical protein